MSTATVKKESPATKAPVAKKVAAEKKVTTTVVKKTAADKTEAIAKAAPAEASVRVKAPVKPANDKVPFPKSPVETVDKVKKSKLIRDSFTMPEEEYAILGLVKKSCLKAGVDVKKSQLLRIGLLLLGEKDVPALKALIADLSPLKAGRPKKEK
ncbi:hypothetical protein ACO0LB_08080 [Undibacterium sp. SXout7W]|uniref:hypothetical protein n=1 Tax=Undibacterium sp. SXout7W TaxID=3413049 RepID=UPI003BF1739C